MKQMEDEKARLAKDKERMLLEAGRREEEEALRRELDEATRLKVRLGLGLGLETTESWPTQHSPSPPLCFY